MPQVPVPVARAMRLYAEYKRWYRVADHLLRPNGTKFQAEGIKRAVARAIKAEEECSKPK